jgi:predicted dehydrogenase
MRNSSNTEHRPRQWTYGLIGCGRFGSFCLESLRGWERLRPSAAADVICSLAEEVAGKFSLSACATTQELLGRPEVDLILISTPPETHHSLTLQALQAGKHVICEKPLALTLEQADELIRAAAAAGRLLAVNHVLRYSPLFETAERIIQERILGEPLHYFFENYAEDERLPRDHWFWESSKSGGIFIEHGVHFFDLYHWWFGRGEVLAAHAETRPGTNQVDRVWCALRHQNGVLGHHYHGFDQPVRLDRADHRIVFERGELAVFGWIPMELRLRGIVNDEQEQRLRQICRECETVVVQRYENSEQYCRGRGNDYRVTVRIEMTQSLKQDKGLIYGEMIKSLLDDQLRLLEEPGHIPRLQIEDARQALATAVEATDIASQRQALR